MRTMCITILAAAFAAAATPLMAAIVSYTPQGSAPYYWNDATAWGGTEPGSGDEAIANDSLLLANPLTVATGTSPSVGTNRLGNCILQIENGASLSMSGGSMLLAGDANQTSIVTNYGTVSVNDLQLGVYGGSGGIDKGKLAQFDNFGTLNIGTYFRIGIKGTRSIFYNHEGATFNKTGGGQYTFYMATDSGGDSTIINEGTMVCGSGTETWTGNSNSKNEIIMRKSGTFNPGPLMKIGHSTSTTTINLYDNSKLLGSTQYRVGGVSGAKGYITLSNESSIVTSNSMYLGYEASTIGSIALADYATASLGYTQVGRGSSSKGIMTLTDNSRLVIDSSPDVIHFGYAANSSGSLSLSDSATADIRRPVFLGTGAASRGTISLAGNSQLFLTNNYELIVGYSSGGTGVLQVADNAVLHAPFLKIGQTSVAGTTGFATLSGNATLFSTNILIPAWGDRGRGTLEVADNAVITNLQYLKVGLSGNTSPQAVKMRGGSIYFDIDPENAIFVSQGYHDPLMLNENRTVVRGFIRGWGKIAFSDVRTYVTDAAKPSGIVHYGPVIADGEGVERDLDFSRFGALNYNTTDANPSGSNGWFAVNRARLKMPRSLPRKTANYRCVGDYWGCDHSTSEPSDATLRNRLCNTFTCTFTGAELNNYIFAELYATDRSDIPAGLENTDAAKVISVWRAGLFDDGPEVDDPTHPSSFTSAQLHFRYPNVGDDLAGMTRVCVYHHDGTAGGRWRRIGSARPSSTWPVVPATLDSRSAANWNMGWFAVVARDKTLGAVLLFR